MDYNGWRNYETWNVALWILNDEPIYNLAREIAESGYHNPYNGVVENLEDIGVYKTPDDVSFRDSYLDISALNNMIRELA